MIRSCKLQGNGILGHEIMHGQKIIQWTSSGAQGRQVRFLQVMSSEDQRKGILEHKTIQEIRSGKLQRNVTLGRKIIQETSSGKLQVMVMVVAWCAAWIADELAIYIATNNFGWFDVHSDKDCSCLLRCDFDVAL